MPPHSSLFSLRSIEGAGRGLVALSDIAKDTVLLEDADLAICVIFREYRKEVCAQCFHYDRGRTLPVRDNTIGKVFCTTVCQTAWQDEHGEVEYAAWRQLESFLKNNSKNLRSLTTDMLQGPKPTSGVVISAWQTTDADICNKQLPGRSHKKHCPEDVYPDILGFELSAILFHHAHGDLWTSEIESLVTDPVPYKSIKELEATCNSIKQLASILPSQLLDSCNSSISLTASGAGNHNAFGIRAGGEDAEEYMGWAIYPNASYFNHACDRNLSKLRSGRCWSFRAARDIAAGEQLCISYLGGDEKDLSLSTRRSRLEQTWGFICRCHRCEAEADANQVEIQAIP